MISTKIEFSFNLTTRIQDLADLAEILFPGNRNQQHAFLVLWISLKWSADRLVPNLAEVAREQVVSRRTFERVRAKMKRIGLIEHVSRFNARYGHRDGWVLSGRFERGLRRLGQAVDRLKDRSISSREKDMLLLQMAEARRAAAPDSFSGDHEIMGRPDDS